uniref:F-box domain-containing protein n=1 Tax=Aegilops tauschii TaxID=37682 RepID=M8BWU7_AEGTA
MTGGDRLSSLPDDLLRHILYFALVKEGATTGALGRRWRSLWPSSGAVNLDSRSYDDLDRYSKRYVIMRDAREAFAAADGNVTKLTFCYSEGEDDDHSDYESFAFHDDVCEAKQDMARELEALLSSPAASRLEELRIGLFYGPDSDAPGAGMLYNFSIGSLPPSRSLRVLHLSKCMNYDHEVHDPFHRLVELRLHLCGVSFHLLQAHLLQGVIDGAPQLATLDLDGSELWTGDPRWQQSVVLRCPRVTTLVLANLDDRCWGDKGQNTMELDAPLLRWFRYQGPVRSLSLKSPQPDMTRVDLRLHVPADVPTDGETCRTFVQSFSNATIVNVDFELLDDQYDGGSVPHLLMYNDAMNFHICHLYFESNP